MFVDRAKETMLQHRKNTGFLDLLLERFEHAGSARNVFAGLFSNPQTVSLNMAAGNTSAVHDARRAQIDCFSGRAWLTAQGVHKDYDLRAGGRIHLDQGGKIILMAMADDTNVRVSWV